MVRRSTTALVILTILVVILLALQTPLLRAVRGTLWGTWVKSVARLTTLGPLEIDHTVVDHIQQLRAENIRLHAELNDYHRLRQQLGSPSVDQLRAIPAVVTVAPVDSFRSELLLNRGAAHGLTLGAPVVVNGSMLVGIITELHEQTAVCRLLVHPAMGLPAEVAGIDHARGLSVGRTYTTVNLTTVPRDAALVPAQAVVTTTHEHMPAGLLIGTIATIQNEENEAYQTAHLNLPYDRGQLRAVNVLVAP